jgi:asparagine synthase (glutamine-hydrolysing)
MNGWSDPDPGAVAIISSACTADGRRHALEHALRPFRGHSTESLCDGPLVLAWRPTDGRSVHADPDVVCLLEGYLYELEHLRQITAGDVTGGDAAALLARAWLRAGTGVLPGLRGEFWALLWDRRRRAGELVADQLGTRSPFFTQYAGGVAVATEVRELLGVLPVRPAPDPVVLAHWLQLSSPPHGRTLYAGVRRLQAGHHLPLGSGAGDPARYWSPRYAAPLSGSREALVAAARDALSRSVSRRLNGIDRAGVLLSGGIDSSAVAALAAAAGRPLHAYSAVFPKHPETDESDLIEATVQRLGMPSTRIVVRAGGALAGALAYLDAWALPPPSPNQFFWAPLMQRAGTDGMVAMLDGEGGDETFHFSPYLLADRLRAGRLPSALALARGWTPPAHPDSLRRVWIRLRRFGLKGSLPASAHILARRVRATERYAPPWLGPELGRAWLRSEQAFYEWKQMPGPRWWSFLQYGIARSVGPAMVYEQSLRRGALAGVDTRHPLVDVDVVELVLRTPPELAFDARYNRPLLREAVAGLLPDSVRLRGAKSNFNATFVESLAGADLPAIRRLVRDPAAMLRSYVDVDLLCESLLDRDPPPAGPGQIGWAVRVWRLATAECWLRSQGNPAFTREFPERERLAEPEYELVERTPAV